MKVSASRASHGRYDPRHRDARFPANGLPSPVASANMRTTVGIVPDPLEPGKELWARINTRVDVLEMERSKNRISEGAYRVGRELQAIFEAAASIGSGNQWKEGDRVDVSLAIEQRIQRNVQAAFNIEAEMEGLRAAVGWMGARFLREILATSTSFADYAKRTTDGNRRDVDRVADRFRVMLEQIVEFKAARGRAA